MFVGMPLLLWALWGLRRPGLNWRERWLAAALAVPCALSVYSMSGTIYRYQFEALLPFLLVLGPEATRVAQTAKGPARVVFWLLIAVGLGLCIGDVIWVTRTLCEWWHWC